MHYVRLDEHYERFFGSGKSIYSRKTTSNKCEFIKSLHYLPHYLIVGLFEEYMDDDITINHKVC
jgi:hypothetical protein